MAELKLITSLNCDPTVQGVQSMRQLQERYDDYDVYCRLACHWQTWLMQDMIVLPLSVSWAKSEKRKCHRSSHA